MHKHLLFLAVCVLASCVASSVFAEDTVSAALQSQCDANIVSSCISLALLYKRGEGGVVQDHAKAAALYQRACDVISDVSGSKSMACYHLSLQYAQGEGVAPDLARAATLFQKTCNADLWGCYTLRFLYLHARVEDVASTIPIFQKSCDSGYAPGCYVLARLYYLGEGVTLDLAKAATFFQKACDLDDLFGCYYLGAAYEHGEGVAKDPTKAVSLYQTACDKGFYGGCNGLGLFYLDGENAEKDPMKAAAFFQAACDLHDDGGCTMSNHLRTAHDPDPIHIDNTSAILAACGADNAKTSACTDLIDAYFHNDNNTPSKIVTLFQKACDLGHASSCVYLGLCYEWGHFGLVPDPTKSAAAYRKACDHGSLKDYAGGCSHLGLLYGKGEGVFRDFAKAAYFNQKACDYGDAWGCVPLGVAYESAQNVPKDLARAGSFFQKSCDLGSDYNLGCDDAPRTHAEAMTLSEKACDGGDADACAFLYILRDENPATP